MRWSNLAVLLAALLASPAHAERLVFDYRDYAPLKAVLDSGRTEMLRYDDSNPKYIPDRIAIQGTSVDQWTEALDIIVRLRGSKMRTTADWSRQIERQSRALCPSTFTVIAQDANSLTFQRSSTGCPAGTPLTGLYRIVAGKRSLFMLAGLTMAEMTEPQRQQWLALLATARLSS